MAEEVMTGVVKGLQRLDMLEQVCQHFRPGESC